MRVSARWRGRDVVFLLGALVALGCSPTPVNPPDPETIDAPGDVEGFVCTPATCDELAAECGELPDGCGAVVECGTCPLGEICGGGNSPNSCGPRPCDPLSCEAVGACGEASDGCGGVLDCECDVVTEPACEPLRCGGQGSCGLMDDGCGGEVDCGPCADDGATPLPT